MSGTPANDDTSLLREATVAVNVANDWFLVESVVPTERGTEPDEHPAGLPERFVVLTAGGTDGVLRGGDENAERHHALLERIAATEPWVRPPVLLPARVITAGSLLPAVAVDLSREEACDIAHAFGQSHVLEFESGRRLLVPTGDKETGVVEGTRISRAEAGTFDA